MIDYFNEKHQTDYEMIFSGDSEALRIYEKTDGNWTNYCIGDEIIFTHRIGSVDKNLFPDHLSSHNYYEMAILKEGSISYFTEKLDFILEDGHVIIIPPNSLHCSKKYRDCSYNRYIFYFTPDFFSLCGKHSAPKLFSSDVPQKIKLDPGITQECYTELENIEQLLSSEKEGRAVLAHALLLRLFFFLSENSSRQTSSKLLPDNLREIKNYIDENYCQINTVNELADKFHYSREYLSRLFRSHFNVSIFEYLQIRKMEEAKHYLKAGNSVTDTYLHVGYANLTSFIIAFKKYTGRTPKEYKTEPSA